MCRPSSIVLLLTFLGRKVKCSYNIKIPKTLLESLGKIIITIINPNKRTIKIYNERLNSLAKHVYILIDPRIARNSFRLRFFVEKFLVRKQGLKIPKENQPKQFQSTSSCCPIWVQFQPYERTTITKPKAEIVLMKRKASKKAQT